MARLRRGDLPPRMVRRPRGPAGRRVERQLRAYEAPGINTLGSDGSTLVWQEARGSNVLDVDGNRYIDLTAGFAVAAVGHRHPEVVRAVRSQAGLLLHGLGDVHAHPLRSVVAKELLRIVPVDDAQVYFAVSGADAVEIAVKTALLATGHDGVLAFTPAYHGLSFGTLHLSSREEFRAPFSGHFQARVERLAFGSSAAEIDSFLEQHPATACAVIEPIAGREGILLPPDGWLRELEEICRRRRVLLIADEIFTGLGRTGSWFAVEHEGVEPDLLCCGKGLGGGLPIAAVIGRRRLMTAWSRDGEPLHTGTFVAHPLACAAALAVLRVLRAERLPQRAARLGKNVGQTLEAWPARYRSVAAVRGRGLMWAIELTDPPAAHRLATAIERRGLLALVGGPDGRILQLNPPLTIAADQLRRALEIIAASLDET